MATTRPQMQVAMRDYDEVRERVYEKVRGIKGFISWKEIVHTDKLAEAAVIEVSTSRVPDHLYLNGIEYVPLTL